MNDERFYIQHTECFAGDYILWWGPDNNGYTYDLDRAGLYSKQDASQIVAMRRRERAWPESLARNAANTVVSIERLRRLERKTW